jgi:hypothetical protein
MNLMITVISDSEDYKDKNTELTQVCACACACACVCVCVDTAGNTTIM